MQLHGDLTAEYYTGLATRAEMGVLYKNCCMSVAPLFMGD